MVCPVTSAVLDLVRPKQWLKNVLVVAAPLAAGALRNDNVARDTFVAFVAFCLASSATYCLNDVLDAESDATHPVKRNRPIPSGRVSRRTALVTSAALAVLAVTIAFPGSLRLVVLLYLVTTAAYSRFFKHQPVIELGLVSAGFILRAIAGGAATGVPLSQWFLIVAGFGSLFMVTGKRLSELTRAESSGATAARAALAHYPLSYLRMILAISASVTIAAYCLWAFDTAEGRAGAAWTTLSIVPFVLALLRYALDTDRGKVEEPEEVVLRDRTLLLLGLCWLVTYAMGVAL
jgi:decaprenyl-phosphate phosphoribosyltransferase